MPSLLGEDELQYLHWLTRAAYKGRGEIVDLGAFLGSSTAALALGLADSGTAPAWKIKSYDYFNVVEKHVLPEYLLKLPQFAPMRHRQPGASFLDIYLETLGDLIAFVEPREGDITQMFWDGSEIEIMHVDIMKSWEITDHVIRHFFAALLPGAMMINQDIKLQYCDWIILSMGELRDYFQPAHNQWGNMMSFKVTGRIPDRVLNQGFDQGLREASDAETHFDWLISYLDQPQDRALVDGARLFWILERGNVDKGLAFLDWCSRQYSDWCFYYFIATVFTHRPDFSALLNPEQIRAIDEIGKNLPRSGAGLPDDLVSTLISQPLVLDQGETIPFASMLSTGLVPPAGTPTEYGVRVEFNGKQSVWGWPLQLAHLKSRDLYFRVRYKCEGISSVKLVFYTNAPTLFRVMPKPLPLQPTAKPVEAGLRCTFRSAPVFGTEEWAVIGIQGDNPRTTIDVVNVEVFWLTPNIE